MKRLLIFTFIIQFCMLGFSQSDLKKEWKFKHESKGAQFVRDVQMVEDESTGRYFTFIRERSHTFLYVLNADKQVEQKVTIPNKNFSNVNLEGVILEKDMVHIVSQLKKVIYYYTVDLNSGETSYKLIEFKSPKENNICIVDYKNKIYIVNTVKKESVIRLYTIDNTGAIATDDLPFVEDEFLLRKVLFNFSKQEKSTIEPNLPVNLTSTRQPVKIYQRNNLLNITIDNVYKTYTTQIDLGNKQIEYFVNDANLGDREQMTYTKFNSFLLNENLIQTINTNQGVDVHVKNLKTDEVKKTFHVKRDEDIAFKNSPILLEKGNNNKRTLTKTNQFLRKINGMNAKLSVAAFESNGNIQMTLGSVALQQAGAGGMWMMGAMGGMAGGAIAASAGSVTFYYNPTYMMYNNYQNKVTTIHCLLDQNFNSVEGEIQENVFDRIKNDEGTREIVGKSIISSKDHVLVGRYNEVRDVYELTEYKY